MLPKHKPLEAAMDVQSGHALHGSADSLCTLRALCSACCTSHIAYCPLHMPCLLSYGACWSRSCARRPHLRREPTSASPTQTGARLASSHARHAPDKVRHAACTGRHDLANADMQQARGLHRAACSIQHTACIMHAICTVHASMQRCNTSHAARNRLGMTVTAQPHRISLARSMAFQTVLMCTLPAAHRP